MGDVSLEVSNRFEQLSLESSARMVDVILTNTLQPEVSRELLNRFMECGSPQKVSMRVHDGTFAYEYAWSAFSPTQGKSLIGVNLLS